MIGAVPQQGDGRFLAQKVGPSVRRQISTFVGRGAPSRRHHRHGGGVLSLARVATGPLRLRAQQIPVKVLPERAAHPIQSHGIGAGIQIGQAEADDPGVMPKGVVVLLRLRMEVEEQHEDVRRQKTHGKDQDEDQHGHRHLFPGPDLSLGALHFAGDVFRAYYQVVGHF